MAPQSGAYADPAPGIRVCARCLEVSVCAYRGGAPLAGRKVKAMTSPGRHSSLLDRCLNDGAGSDGGKCGCSVALSEQLKYTSVMYSCCPADSSSVPVQQQGPSWFISVHECAHPPDKTHNNAHFYIATIDPRIWLVTRVDSGIAPQSIPHPLAPSDSSVRWGRTI